MKSSQITENFENALQNLGEEGNVQHLADDIYPEFTVWRDDEGDSTKIYAEVGEDAVTAVAYDQSTPGMSDADLFGRGGKAEHVHALAGLHQELEDHNGDEVILSNEIDSREAYEVMGGVNVDYDDWDRTLDTESVRQEIGEMLEQVDANYAVITGATEDAAEYVASMEHSEEGFNAEEVLL